MLLERRNPLRNFDNTQRDYRNQSESLFLLSVSNAIRSNADVPEQQQLGALIEELASFLSRGNQRDRATLEAELLRIYEAAQGLSSSSRPVLFSNADALPDGEALERLIASTFEQPTASAASNDLETANEKRLEKILSHENLALLLQQPEFLRKFGAESAKEVDALKKALEKYVTNKELKCAVLEQVMDNPIKLTGGYLDEAAYLKLPVQGNPSKPDEQYKINPIAKDLIPVKPSEDMRDQAKKAEIDTFLTTLENKLKSPAPAATPSSTRRCTIM